MEASRKEGNIFVYNNSDFSKPNNLLSIAILLTKANTPWHVQLCTTDTKAFVYRPSKP